MGTRSFLRYNENISKFLGILRSSSDIVSGETVAKELGITRSQVFKIVRKLQELGYRFERKRGYKLLFTPDIPFPWEIGQNIVFFNSIHSTQDEAKKLFEASKIKEDYWVLARTQTKGRGRMGRIWESPEGNFYGSVVLKAETPMRDIVKISLIGGISVFRTIKKHYEIDQEIKIKWPNDVWIILGDGKARKISGCIAEAFGEMEIAKYIILGIGVNVKVSPIDGVSICLKDITKKEVSLIDFVRKLKNELGTVWKEFSDGKWNQLKSEIENNMWRGRVKIKYDSREFEGISSGIAEDGSLLVQKDDATFESVYYGDVLIKVIS
ncbi:MAG: biotin--[acetyl-CoA-carboxylase] ligase [Candidatus Calescibacterium sp.]|nr:biotin--[acetyl-CoA-carboxylase] ligase [Candidatus Calescibacterium sp.]MDW8086542.1 biotin--[acetyl-CoA-carboxylase] ligase [Candidatus Calescibacterium sp.]